MYLTMKTRYQKLAITLGTYLFSLRLLDAKTHVKYGSAELVEQAS